MVFSSNVFLFMFLPGLLLLYYLPSGFGKSRKYKNRVLLLFSLGFYWWGEPMFFWMMLLSVVVNWGLGLLIYRYSRYTKVFVILACVYDIGVLFVFKYLNFFTENLSLLIHNMFVTHIALPIGISFFIFQMMSYIFDVAKGTAKCQKNILDLGLYIIMFPQLIAGPIVRYETVADEINNRYENINDFSEGMCRFVWGLGKKVIIANNLGVLADLIFDGEYTALSTPVAWIGALAYTLQILYDFSGYSDMAIGIGRMFGFHFLENFDYPYISKSITEFWRRWHISMGTWFRDYVYFPLGGSRVRCKWKLIRNLLVVWLLTGIWHGANWTFILWGLLYGALIVIEKLTKFPDKLPGGGSHLYTMFFVILGWVLFRVDSIAKAWQYMKAMFGFGAHYANTGAINLLMHYGGVFILAGIIGCIPMKKFSLKLEKRHCIIYNVGYTIALFTVFFLELVYVVKGGYNPFIYFNF